MSKAKFTSEQQQLLRNNSYTVRVTEDVLYLSKEFKELFYKEYLTGAIPRDILEKYGYPSAVLGKQCIWGISHTIRQQYEKAGEFRDVRTPNSSVTASSFPMPRLLRQDVPPPSLCRGCLSYAHLTSTEAPDSVRLRY